MFEDYNKNSQPTKSMSVFNNWDAIVESWYCIGRVEDLDQNNILSTQVGMQKLIIFKNKDGIHCLDAFCTHMGLSLSQGKVVDEKLQCSFHHWAFHGDGKLSEPHCSKVANRNLRSYPVTIRYGLIWIWAGDKALYQLPFHQDLPEGSFAFRLGNKYERPSHPHISLLNALDIQHVNTVHALEMNVTATHNEASDHSFIHYDFEGKFLKTSQAGRRNAWLSGGGYKFSVRYSGATVGYLKALEGIKLFGIIPFPTIYATFGYCPIEKSKTVIQPIFLSPKRGGLFGKLKNALHLRLAEMIYSKLKDEDGAVYENIRFTPNFTSEDATIITFVGHVNRLPLSNF